MALCYDTVSQKLQKHRWREVRKKACKWSMSKIVTRLALAQRQNALFNNVVFFPFFSEHKDSKDLRDHPPVKTDPIINLIREGSPNLSKCNRTHGTKMKVALKIVCLSFTDL